MKDRSREFEGIRKTGFHVRMSREGETLLDTAIPLPEDTAEALRQRWNKLTGTHCEKVCGNEDCNVTAHFALLLESFSRVTSVETLHLEIDRGGEQLAWDGKAAHVAMTVVLAVMSHSSCPHFNRIAWIWNYVPFPSSPDKLRYTLFAYITLVRALHDQDCSAEVLRQSMREVVTYFNTHVTDLLQMARRSYREDALDNALILISAVSRVLDTTYDRQVDDLREEIVRAGVFPESPDAG